MLENYMVQECILIPTMRNNYGDIVPDYTQRTNIVRCRFRILTNAVRTNNREELRSDQAMIWFAPGTVIDMYDIVYYENKYWEIIKVDEARRLGGTKIEFLKCYADAHDVLS